MNSSVVKDDELGITDNEDSELYYYNIKENKVGEFRAIGLKGHVGKDGISENSICKEQ